MNIVSAIFENVLELLPFTLVDQNEKGVFLRCGKFKREALPGAHFTIPLIDRIVTVDAQPQALTLPDIPVVFSGETWVVGCAVTYAIDNAFKYCLCVREPDEILQNMALNVLVDKLTTWKDRRAIEMEVYGVLDEQADSYGISIQDFKIIKMCPARIYMLVGSPPGVPPATIIEE